RVPWLGDLARRWRNDSAFVVALAVLWRPARPCGVAFGASGGVRAARRTLAPGRGLGVELAQDLHVGAGRRESTQRLVERAPARGVVVDRLGQVRFAVEQIRILRELGAQRRARARRLTPLRIGPARDLFVEREGLVRVDLHAANAEALGAQVRRE